MWTFPAFRSDEWVKTLINTETCPEEILKGIDLTPGYMASNPAAALYLNKSKETREQIRRALFRYALFKIQNVEVSHECRADRALVSVGKGPGSLVRDMIDRVMNEDSTKLVSEEIWNVDRCGSNRSYAVRYYREGADGFSTKVFPVRFLDKIAMLRYYFS
jgi:hypothetical protein